MMRIAAIALLVSACGSEPFTNFGDGLEEDGGGVSETSPIVSETGPIVSPDAQACENWALYLPGDDGSYAVLPGARQASLSFSVAFDARVTDGEVRVEMDGPENPCGWSLTVRGSQVKATIPALFDHFTSEGTVAPGWHRIEWRYDGQQSTVLVDDTEVSRAIKPAGQWPFPGCSGPARAEGKGMLDHVSIGPEWLFDEKSGAALVPQGELIGQAVRTCRL